MLIVADKVTRYRVMFYVHVGVRNIATPLVEHCVDWKESITHHGQFPTVHVVTYGDVQVIV